MHTTYVLSWTIATRRVVVGEKEAAEGLVSMRQQGGGEQATMTMEAFADRINAEVADQLKELA